MRRISAVAALALSFTLATPARGQGLVEDLRIFVGETPSYLQTLALMPGGRLLTYRQIGNVNPTEEGLACINPDGSLGWTQPLSYGQYPSHVLATNDDQILYTTTFSSTALRCFNQSGSFQWQYTLPNTQSRLTDCRIFGNSIVAVGHGRSTNLSTSQRTIVVSLNRFTGALNYLREYLINNAAFPGNHLIRSSGGLAFVVAGREPSGTGILKIDPATGSVLASYATAPLTAVGAEVDSAGQIYVGGYTDPPANTHTELRKVNGSGTGAMNLVFRTPGAGGDILLSKGSVFTTLTNVLRRVDPLNGSVLWERPPVAGSTSYSFLGVKGDAQGRIIAVREYSGPAGSYPSWLVAMNPATGGDLLSIKFPRNGSYGGPLLSQYGEVFVAGDVADYPDLPEGLLLSYFTPQQPVDDVYSVVQGETLTVDPGVMVNDLFTNPLRTSISKVNNPPQGTLDLGTDGALSYVAKSGNAFVPVGPQTFTYRSTRQGIVREANVTINVIRGFQALTMARPDVAGLTSVSGTVTMTSPGPSAVIALASDSTLISIPASVTVPVNKGSATFIAHTTDYVTTAVNVTLTATLAATTRSAALIVHPIGFTAITGASYVPEGGDATMQVVFNGPVGPGSETVTLSSDSPDFTVPPSVTVAPGQTSANFNVHGQHATNQTGGYLKAKWKDRSYLHKVFLN